MTVKELLEYIKTNNVPGDTNIGVGLSGYDTQVNYHDIAIDVEFDKTLKINILLNDNLIDALINVLTNIRNLHIDQKSRTNKTR